MVNNIEERAKLFSKYVGSELKGAIASHGYSQGKVADALGHARSAMSKWLNAKPPIDVAVANKICDYIGMDIAVVIRRAEQRVIDDLGPWPPVQIDPSLLTDDQKADKAMDDLAKNIGIAALHDKNKNQEMGYYPDAGA